jgi:hypothetical protein
MVVLDKVTFDPAEPGQRLRAGDKPAGSTAAKIMAESWLMGGEGSTRKGKNGTAENL